MKKALILAENYHHYKWFIQHFRLPRDEYRYITGQWDELCGWWIDQPIILLEGWERNPRYSLGLMHQIGHRFDNIGMLTEGEMWQGEEVPIQYVRR